MIKRERNCQDFSSFDVANNRRGNTYPLFFILMQGETEGTKEKNSKGKKECLDRITFHLFSLIFFLFYPKLDTKLGLNFFSLSFLVKEIALQF